MRIVYLGNFRHSWCTEVHVARDATKIEGVEVIKIQEPSGISDFSRFLELVEATASEADLLIYQRTWGLPHEAIDLWGRLEMRGCKTISYHLDLYVGLKREDTIEDDPFWQTGTVFTADGDPATTEWLAARGIDHRWMPAAVVSDEVYRVEGHARAPMDVVFVGSAPATYHDEWPWRRILIDGLRGRYGARFQRLPENNVRIHGRDLNLLYSTVPVVVGDSLALPGHRNYWSDRFYETVGRGGYLIGPNVPGIEQHFRSGEHLDLYEIGDLGHVVELVDQALADRESTREIARAGQAHVSVHHTYVNRVRAILESLALVP